MLLFVIHQRFITHLRNNNFPLLHVVERRIQRHEAVPAFSFRPLISCRREKLFSERSVADVTTICGTLRHSSRSLIADADPDAVEPDVDLAIAHHPRRPFGYRRA